MRRRGRQLTEDERVLWRKVTHDVARDQPVLVETQAPHSPETPVPAPKPIRRSLASGLTMKPTGSKAPPISVPQPPRAVPSGLDRRTEEKLRKGRRTPDARLDLHGMSAARAHTALKIFIADSQAMGRRCVLIITGKGSDAQPEFGEVAPGVLRREAPRWLSTPPLSQMVVNVSQAHTKHGGRGALYVYLKRKR